MCSATRGLEPCTIPEEAPSMHCPGSDPSHAQRRRNIEPVYSAMPDFTCANPGVSRSMRRGLDDDRTAQRTGESGARHPHASPRLGRTFSARGHTEREDAGVKGRRDPRSRARRMTRRAGRETLRRTECARRTMIPKIVFPSLFARTRVSGAEPLRQPRPQDPQAVSIIIRGQRAPARVRRHRNTGET